MRQTFALTLDEDDDFSRERRTQDTSPTCWVRYIICPSLIIAEIHEQDASLTVGSAYELYT